MEYGVHLPLMPLADRQLALPHLLEYAKTAERLGFRAVAANLRSSGVCTPLARWTRGAGGRGRCHRADAADDDGGAPRGATVVLAKGLAALDLLSGGRLIAAVGAGSSPRDYAAVGIPFEERWQRLEEAVPALRALWCPNRPPFRAGSTAQRPGPAARAGPATRTAPLDRDLGLGRGAAPDRSSGRRVARVGIQHHTGRFRGGADPTPDAPAGCRQGSCPLPQRASDNVPIYHRGSTAPAAERMVSDVLSPALNREATELRPRLLVGSAQECAEDCRLSGGRRHGCSCGPSAMR